jgi:hypothetical protein
MQFAPRILIAAAAAIAASAAQASAVTVDFEDASLTFGSTVASAGFNFTPASGTIAAYPNGAGCSITCSANGTTTLYVPGSVPTPASAAPLTMVDASAATFRLLGFDFAEFFAGSSGSVANADTLVVAGKLVGGGTVSQSFALDGLGDGPDGIADFQGAALAGFWASSVLTSLNFTGTRAGSGDFGFQLDNIATDVTAAAVPEPTSLLLVACALTGLAATRRKARSV